MHEFTVNVDITFSKGSFLNSEFHESCFENIRSLYIPTI